MLIDKTYLKTLIKDIGMSSTIQDVVYLLKKNNNYENKI